MNVWAYVSTLASLTPDLAMFVDRTRIDHCRDLWDPPTVPKAMTRFIIILPVYAMQKPLLDKRLDICNATVYDRVQPTPGIKCCA